MAETTKSSKHEEIKDILFEIAETTRSFEKYKELLRQRKIRFEEIELANGRELLIFTAPSSAFDIIGCSVFFNKYNKQIVIDEMYN